MGSRGHDDCPPLSTEVSNSQDSRLQNPKLPHLSHLTDLNPTALGKRSYSLFPKKISFCFCLQIPFPGLSCFPSAIIYPYSPPPILCSHGAFQVSPTGQSHFIPQIISQLCFYFMAFLMVTLVSPLQTEGVITPVGGSSSAETSLSHFLVPVSLRMVPVILAIPQSSVLESFASYSL